MKGFVVLRRRWVGERTFALDHEMPPPRPRLRATHPRRRDASQTVAVTLLKRALILILSGIPSLATHVAKEKQLFRLLQTVSFEKIDLTRQTDLDDDATDLRTCKKVGP